MTADLSPLFDPAGVVVAGASSHPGKFGFVTLHNILSCGYEGRVFATNLQGETVLGVETVTSLDQVPAGVADLLVVCTPASTVPDLLRQAADIGITAAFVTSGGFSETGTAEGAAEEEALSVLADELGIVLAGPNGQGVISTPAALCAQIVAPYPPPGSISLVSQSGNLVSAFQNLARQSGVGIARSVSAGNARNLGVIDYLEWYAQDPATAASVVYLEGLEDARGFYERLKVIAPQKPVVVVKGGSSAEGAKAAASHTGSLATDDRVFDGLLRQAGAIRAPSVEEAFAAAATLATLPLPAGPRLAVLTSVGGWGVLTADAIAASSLELAELPDDLFAEIDNRLPPRWSKSNPIDMAGGETRDTIPELLGLLANHGAVDAVVLLGIGVQGNTAALMRGADFYPDHGLERIVGFHERQERRYAETVVQVAREANIPVVAATELATADPTNPAVAAFRDAGVPCFSSGPAAVRALDATWRFQRFRQARGIS